jgi:hypothetical protein
MCYVSQDDTAVYTAVYKQHWSLSTVPCCCFSFPIAHGRIVPVALQSIRNRSVKSYTNFSCSFWWPDSVRLARLLWATLDITACAAVVATSSD